MIGVILWFSVLPGVAAAPSEFQIGDTVVVIRESDIKVGTTVVRHVWPGADGTVGAIKDNYLWVNSPGKAGWISKSNVIPLQGAVMQDSINHADGCGSGLTTTTRPWPISSRPSKTIQNTSGRWSP